MVVKSRLCGRNKTKRLKTMIIIDVFDKIDNLSYRNGLEQLFYCRDSIITTDVIKSSRFKQKTIYSDNKHRHTPLMSVSMSVVQIYR